MLLMVPAIQYAKSVTVRLTYWRTFLKILVGSVTLLVGSNGQSGSSDGAVTAALFSFPTSVAVDTSLNVYVGDANGYRKIASSGMLQWLSLVL
jgi:hypothetical protein